MDAHRLVIKQPAVGRPLAPGVPPQPQPRSLQGDQAWLSIRAIDHFDRPPPATSLRFSAPNAMPSRRLSSAVLPTFEELNRDGFRLLPLSSQGELRPPVAARPSGYLQVSKAKGPIVGDSSGCKGAGPGPNKDGAVGA